MKKFIGRFKEQVMVKYDSDLHEKILKERKGKLFVK